MTLAQKEKSEVSTHPVKVISEHRPCPSPGMPEGPAWRATHPAFLRPQIAPTSVVPFHVSFPGKTCSAGGCGAGMTGWEGKGSPAPTSGFSILLLFLAVMEKKAYIGNEKR